jgi:hypothetical protein
MDFFSKIYHLNKIKEIAEASFFMQFKRQLIESSCEWVNKALLKLTKMMKA